MSKKDANIAEISKKAMVAQLASFRIEGIAISKRRAEQIRREVLADLAKTTQPIR